MFLCLGLSEDLKAHDASNQERWEREQQEQAQQEQARRQQEQYRRARLEEENAAQEQARPPPTMEERDAARRICASLHLHLPVAEADPPAEQRSQPPLVLGLPHYRQHHTWDCGVACLQMVLNYNPDLVPGLHAAARPPSEAAAATTVVTSAAATTVAAAPTAATASTTGAGAPLAPSGGGLALPPAAGARPIASPAAALPTGAPLPAVRGGARVVSWDELWQSGQGNSLWTIDLGYLLKVPCPALPCPALPCPVLPRPHVRCAICTPLHIPARPRPPA